MISFKPEKRFSVTEALAKARQTRCVEIGPGALQSLSRVYQSCFAGRTAVIVADATTMAVAGEEACRLLKAAGVPLETPFVYDDPALYAEHGFVESLESALRKHNGVPVAVGAGTINDLAKLAAHRVNREYMSVATAASMDGYTAFGASITYKGSKQTFMCPAPVAVVADLDLIAAAPAAMTAAGYADLLAKVTAGADWLVAGALAVERIDETAWHIVQGGLPQALADPAGVRRGDREAVRHLTEGLLLGGFAMQSVQSSRPASGAEHQFSHLWDMQHHTFAGAAPSHGFKVGVSTVATAALHEYVLSQPLERLDVERGVAARLTSDVAVREIRALFADREIAEKAVEETSAKLAGADVLRDRLTLLRKIWPELRNRLREQLRVGGDLQARLRAVGAPADPEQIGITRERLRASFLQAYYIRRRYTVLDLAVEAGLLNGALDHLFGVQGRWPVSKAGVITS